MRARVRRRHQRAAGRRGGANCCCSPRQHFRSPLFSNGSAACRSTSRKLLPLEPGPNEARACARPFRSRPPRHGAPAHDTAGITFRLSLPKYRGWWGSVQFLSRRPGLPRARRKAKPLNVWKWYNQRPPYRASKTALLTDALPARMSLSSNLIPMTHEDRNDWHRLCRFCIRRSELDFGTRPVLTRIRGGGDAEGAPT